MSNERRGEPDHRARELPPIEPALRHARVEDRRAQDQRLRIARDLLQEAFHVGGVVLTVGVELDRVAEARPRRQPIAGLERRTAPPVALAVEDLHPRIPGLDRVQHRARRGVASVVDHEAVEPVGLERAHDRTDAVLVVVDRNQEARLQRGSPSATARRQRPDANTRSSSYNRKRNPPPGFDRSTRSAKRLSGPQHLGELEHLEIAHPRRPIPADRRRPPSPSAARRRRGRWAARRSARPGRRDRGEPRAGARATPPLASPARSGRLAIARLEERGQRRDRKLALRVSRQRVDGAPDPRQQHRVPARREKPRQRAPERAPPLADQAGRARSR